MANNIINVQNIMPLMADLFLIILPALLIIAQITRRIASGMLWYCEL